MRGAGERQPWAERQVQPAKPTEEQLAWLKEEGFIKDEEEEGEEKVPSYAFTPLPLPAVAPRAENLSPNTVLIKAPVKRKLLNP